MRKLIIAALAATALLPLQTQAIPSIDSFELRSAQDLVDLCAVPDNDPMVEAAHGFCYGFLSGAGSYHRALNAGKDAHPLYCLPKTVESRAEVARLFVDWSRANPQYMGEPAIDTLIRFAVQTWPCK